MAAILDSGEVGINAADESEITAIQVSPEITAARFFGSINKPGKV